jgi:hypothetical protein
MSYVMSDSEHQQAGYMASTTREQRIQYAHEQYAERVASLTEKLAALTPADESRRAGLEWHLAQAERVRDLRLNLEEDERLAGLAAKSN